MNLALNNQQSLVWHKTKPNQTNTKESDIYSNKKGITSEAIGKESVY